MPYYARQPRPHELAGGELVLYRDWDAIASQARRGGDREADVAIVTSYCPDALAAAELCSRTSRAAAGVLRPRHAGDADAARGAARRPAISARAALRDFDLVLSYTGGARSTSSGALGARASRRSTATSIRTCIAARRRRSHYARDLSYLGTYAADRQAALERCSSSRRGGCRTSAS